MIVPSTRQQLHITHFIQSSTLRATLHDGPLAWVLSCSAPHPLAVLLALLHRSAGVASGGFSSTCSLQLLALPSFAKPEAGWGGGVPDWLLYLWLL